jgi:hypothetical protein
MYTYSLYLPQCMLPPRNWDLLHPLFPPSEWEGGVERVSIRQFGRMKKKPSTLSTLCLGIQVQYLQTGSCVSTVKNVENLLTTYLSQWESDRVKSKQFLPNWGKKESSGGTGMGKQRGRFLQKESIRDCVTRGFGLLG